MGIRNRVLELLEENKDICLSGSDMAEKLGVTRTSVWKAIKSLRKEGFEVTGVTNKGYKLEKTGDLLTSAGINRYIKTQGIFIIETRKLVTSTNSVLLSEAVKGAPEGYVLAANAQSSGKGRLGRKWFSPPGNAAYFSVILKPKIKAEEAMLITAAAAVASAQAIESIFNISVGIKWVNDLYFEGKKLCGILTEASFDLESRMIDNAVLGIGINITRPGDGYPEEIRDNVTSITKRYSGKDSERCRLIAATLDNFWKFYINLSKREFLDEYRSRSILLGKEVLVSAGNGIKIADALAIDDDCGLVVRYKDGSIDTLRFGEVKVSKNG